MLAIAPDRADLLFEAGQLNARLDKRRAAIAAYERLLGLGEGASDPELRRRAVWTNWRGIADLAPGGGYGEVYGSLQPVPGRGSAPAEEFAIDGGPATVGIVGSVTNPFCDTCNRIRLTADGAAEALVHVLLDPVATSAPQALALLVADLPLRGDRGLPALLLLGADAAVDPGVGL